MDQGFCGYEEIANILQERGYNVSKSSVHRYGQKLNKLAAVQASTQAAMMIADAAPDDSDMRSSAVLSLVQTELFNALIALQESEILMQTQRIGSCSWQKLVKALLKFPKPL